MFGSHRQESLWQNVPKRRARTPEEDVRLKATPRPCGCDGAHCCTEEQRLYAAYTVLWQRYQASRTDEDWEAYMEAVLAYRRHFGVNTVSVPWEGDNNGD